MIPPVRHLHLRWLAAMTLALAFTETLAAGLQKTVLVTGCENPMQVEVLADGRLLYAERGGKVKLWSPATKASSVVWQCEVEVHANSSTPPTGGAWEASVKPAD